MTPTVGLVVIRGGSCRVCVESPEEEETTHPTLGDLETQCTSPGRTGKIFVRVLPIDSTDVRSTLVSDTVVSLNSRRTHQRRDYGL